MRKERLDVLMVQRKLAPSREKAKALIMAGEVLVGGQREDKAGTMVDAEADITVKGGKLRYVSRGGLKLEKAMQTFAGVTPEGKVCMDVGASTGGFTDCMLQNGARKVYAVDVGRGQLDWGLRNDPRVVCMERTNIRYVAPEDIDEPPSFVSIDVSFISLTKVLGPVRDLMTTDGDIICLIKPQFEAGREKVGKKGVVRDPKVHEEVIRRVIAYAAGIGLLAQALTYSPVKGPEGNIEYLVWLKKRTEAEISGRMQDNSPIDSQNSGEVPVDDDHSPESVVSEAGTLEVKISGRVNSDVTIDSETIARTVAEAHAKLD